MLCFRQKEERTNRLVEIGVQIAGVLGNADDLVLSLGSDTLLAEVFSDRILVLEKLPLERLVDDHHAT